jgi:general L-amino acid transport system permease protein
VAQEVTDSTEIAAPAKIPFWHDPTKRAIIYQIVVLGMVGLVSYYLFTNTLANLERQNIATGLGFFSKEASFEIGEPPIPYSAADTYARALLVGLLNTIKVSFIGIILTVILGTFVGIARLSANQTGSHLYRSHAGHPGAPAFVFLVRCLL